jgi:hypothetical protein
MALRLCDSMFHYFHPFKRHSSKIYIIFLQVLCFIYYTFNMCHIFIGCILGSFFNNVFFVFFIIGWQAPEVKHLQVKVLKMLHQKLMCPSLGCMPFD